MRPKRSLSPGDNPVPAPTSKKSKNSTSKGGLKLSTVGKPVASASTDKGKQKAVQFVASGSEYGEDEIDELADDEDDAPVPSSDSEVPVAPPAVKKVKIRVGSTSKATRDDENDSQDEETSELQMAKIVFAAQKKDVRTRPVHVKPDIEFELFMFYVAKAFGGVAGEQDLVWKTDRMAKSDKNWHELKNEEDLEMIMAMGVSTLEEELKKAEVVVAKNKEAKNKCLAKGKPFFPKPVPPLVDFLIILRDCNNENKGKEPKQEKKSTKKVATAGALKDIGEKILDCIDKIKARKCGLCKKSCAVLPGEGAEPKHRELTESEIQTWAQQAAKRGDTSFEKVPKELMLQLMDRKPEQRGNSKKTEASGSNQPPVPPLEGPVPSLAPAPPHYGHPYLPPPPAPPHYGYYPPYPPPYPSYGCPGYGHPPPPPPPHDQNYGGPPRVTGQTRIADWLSMCDRGQRGASGDNYSALIAGFSARNLHYLSDIQGKNAEYFAQIDFPTVPGAPPFRLGVATSSRLHQYLVHDLA
ncbi:hypothetical protein FRC12_021051 [Ceratobasidium sp. 428]|nr:hypothetical protein FRC12_021051 [Ceratobasidium sp. 428]